MYASQSRTTDTQRLNSYFFIPTSINIWRCGYKGLNLVLLLISNLTNGLRLHQFLVTKSGETNKSVTTDANGAH